MTTLASLWPLAVPAAAIAAAGGLGAIATFNPASSLWGPVTTHGPAAAPAVGLTFDDGPNPDASGPILDLLAELRVSAAFFLIGRNIDRWPDLVRRMDAEGHLLGNHTYDHLHFGMLRGSKYWHDQIDRTDERITELTGRRPTLFRPPMGITTRTIHAAARRSGHRVIAWTRRGVDAVRTDTQSILRRLLTGTHGGDILLLHDGVEPYRFACNDRRPTIAAIRPLIQALRERGLEPVRLNRLLQLD